MDGRANIARSLTQTEDIMSFKDTKTEDIRVLGIPADALAASEAHRSARMNSASSSALTIAQSSI